jgi:hypothetical protein
MWIARGAAVAAFAEDEKDRGKVETWAYKNRARIGQAR